MLKRGNTGDATKEEEEADIVQSNVGETAATLNFLEGQVPEA